MKSIWAAATVAGAFALAACGNAESIDPAEIDAENVRREEARSVEVDAAEKVREANDEIHIGGPTDLEVGNDTAPKAEQVPAPGANATPLESK